MIPLSRHVDAHQAVSAYINREGEGSDDIVSPSKSKAIKPVFNFKHLFTRVFSEISISVMAPSVLIIGAGGAFGRPLVEEFIKQKSHFSRVGILADPAKVSKFSDAAAQGIEIVPGSFLDPKAYEGKSFRVINE